MKTSLALVALVAIAVPLAAQTRVKIYMKPPVAVEGFVDDTSKGQRDTFKDLGEQLAKKKNLELVESPEQADVTLTIVDRDAFRETGETVTTTTRMPPLVGGGLSSSTGNVKTHTVTIALTAGDYNRELSASNSALFGSWKFIAGKLSSQVEKWAKENAATIGARRK